MLCIFCTHNSLHINLIKFIYLFQSYYKSGRMLVKLAEAIGRLVLAGRELTKLAGFTARITQLIKVLKDLEEGSYVRTMVGENSKGIIYCFY